MSANQPPPNKRPDHEPLRVRLPGFIADHEIGLGELVTRVTSTLGIRPCGGCAVRADALNRWIALSGKRRS
jgi:hypothetical protein